MNNTEAPPTNIFERALLERFSKLGVGEPDDRILEAVQKAGNIVLSEVKELLNEQFEIRQSLREELKNPD